MRVIKPIPITDANFVSSTTSEGGNPEWAIGDTFALAATCKYLHRVYRSLQAGNIGNAPNVVNSLWWVDIGPTTQWAMFDNEVNTQTTGTGTLTVVVKPGYVNAVALLGLTGHSISVTIRNGLSGPIVYGPHTQLLDGTVVSDYYEYFFEPRIGLSEVVLTNLPPYADAHITVSVIGLNPATSPVACGVLTVGTTYLLGEAEYGATAGITDYSKKDTDEFGITTFVKRNFSKQVNVNLNLPNAKINKVQRVLADLRATPCVWIGVETPGYEPLTVFGWYRDFSINVAYPTTSFCSLEIEGMI